MMNLVRSLWSVDPMVDPDVAHIPVVPLEPEVGLLVTKKLKTATAQCKAEVDRIVEECTRGNRKFRDIEFDLIEDHQRCLYGLERDPDALYKPKDVRRVTDIFEHPEFTKDGATASDICQGALQDCWFLSALAVVGTAKLINKICVARDETVGVYGFIFWRDSGWVNVIIDDYLFTTVAPWEKLSPEEKRIYRDDKRHYNQTARKGSQNMYFARSKTEDETWVPLIEKAYAKLHGDYQSLHLGFPSEGVEDLTGGVSTLVFTNDIMNVDTFWEKELMYVGRGRAFACFTQGTTVAGAMEGHQTAKGVGAPQAEDGLIPGHAYSIIQAVEFKEPGKNIRKFLKVRNPWGRVEWSGPWSDGSAEWNVPWANDLKTALGKYAFGNDGEFIMEYEDFLESWGILERCRLFDETWCVSSKWVKVPMGGEHMPWSHGDVSFTIHVPEDTEAVVVLAQLDRRYFVELSGHYKFNLDFTVYPMEDGAFNPKDPPKRVKAKGSSVHSSMWDRSVKLETFLEKGHYVVQVRVDRKLIRPRKYYPKNMSKWDERKFARKHAELLSGQSVAANFDAATTPPALPLPSRLFRGRSITRLEIETQDGHRNLRLNANAKFNGRLMFTPNTFSSDSLPPQTPTTPATPSSLHPSSMATTSTAFSDGLPTPRRSWTEVSDASSEAPSIAETTESYFSASSNLEPAEAQGDRFSNEPRPRPTSSQRPLSPDGLPHIHISTERTESEATIQPLVQTPTALGFMPNGIGNGSVSFDPSQLQVPRAGTICKGCSHSPTGVVHYCTELTCRGYTLCDPCWQKSVHDRSHLFLKSHDADDDECIKNMNSEHQWDHLVLGLRVYTKKESKAEVKAQLRMGRMLRRNLYRPLVI